MRLLAMLLLSAAMALPLISSAQAPAPATTPEATYAAVFIRLGLGSVSRLSPCYEGRRAELQAVKDRLRSIRVTITPDGHVGAVVPTPRNAVPSDVLTCFMDVIRTWSVPAPTDGRPLRLRFLRRHFAL